MVDGSKVFVVCKKTEDVGCSGVYGGFYQGLRDVEVGGHVVEDMFGRAGRGMVC